MSKSLAAFHHVYDNLIATEEAIKSFRFNHPDSPYFLLGDGGKDYTDIAKKYNCHFFYFNSHLGYPPYGRDGIIEYFYRVFLACAKSNSSHILLMEDDVHIANPIQFEESWEIAGYTGVHNEKIHPFLLDYAQKTSGITASQNWYGGGGGSILNAITFLKTFYKFIDFYYNNFDNIRNNYQYIVGWPDFSTTLLYFTAGKQYTINPRLHEIRNNKFDEITTLKSQYDIFHHYKKFYTK